MVLLGLNGQNNEGRSLFDNEQRKMEGQTPNKRVCEQQIICGNCKY